MNLARSFNAFWKICREDADFRRLGRPPGWSVWFHYRGRWHERRGTTMPVRKISFANRGQRLDFAMTDKYLGAFKGVFNDREYDCGSEFEVTPRRILDLGGNIGFGSVYLAKIFPGAQFAVVEPDPRNLPLLRTNLEANAVRAQVIAGAIGAAAGKLKLRFGDNPTCSSMSGTGMHDLVDAVEVEVATVPVVMARTGWDKIDLVKIDIEGAEEELLGRNNEWLARTGAILVEIHPNTTVDRLNGYLAPFGFVLRRFGSGREPVYFARRNAR